MDDIIFTVTVFLAFILPIAIGFWIYVRMDMRRTLKDSKEPIDRRLENTEEAKFAAAVGFLFIFGGLILTWREMPLAWADGRAQGTVVGQDGRKSGRSRTYAPVVEFMIDGKLVRFTSSLSSDPSPHAVGARVPVRFDPTDPQHAEIDIWYLLWAPLVFPVFGMVVVAVAFIWIRHARKKAAKIRRLLASGTAVEGEIIAYKEAVGGRTTKAYRYAVRWIDPAREIRISWSEKFWGGPHETLIGRRARVLVDPASPTFTYVDLDPLIAEIAPGNIR